MKVSDILAKDIKIVHLEIAILELSAQKQFNEMSSKRDKLIEQARLEVNAEKESRYNIETGEFTEDKK